MAASTGGRLMMFLNGVRGLYSRIYNLRKAVVRRATDAEPPTTHMCLDGAFRNGNLRG